MSIKVSFKLSILALAWTLAGTGWAQSPAGAPGEAAGRVSLAQALRAARQNLDVSLAQRSLAAAQADVRAADRAPVPVLSGKLSQMDLQHGLGAGNPFSQKRIDKGLGLDWTWERGNKRALRTQAAQRAAGAAQADVEDMQLQQLLVTHAAFYDTLAAQERQEQVAAIAQSAQQLAQTAALRVKAGDLAAQDEARTAIEADRAQADTVSARLEAQRSALVLAQLMGQSGARPMPVAAQWPVVGGARQADGPGLTDGELNALVEQRADVRAALERLAAARALVDSTSAQKQADITVGSSVDHFPGTSTRLLEVRAQMPLQGFFGSYNFEGEIARALALQSQAQDALDKTRLMALNDMLRQQQELLAAAKRVQAYQADIVPRARRVAELAELAYNRGAMSLTDVLDARRTLRATLLDSIDARADHARAWGAWQLRTAPQTLVGATP